MLSAIDSQVFLIAIMNRIGLLGRNCLLLSIDILPCVQCRPTGLQVAADGTAETSEKPRPAIVVPLQCRTNLT